MFLGIIKLNEEQKKDVLKIMDQHEIKYTEKLCKNTFFMAESLMSRQRLTKLEKEGKLYLSSRTFSLNKRHRSQIISLIKKYTNSALTNKFISALEGVISFPLIGHAKYKTKRPELSKIRNNLKQWVTYTNKMLLLFSQTDSLGVLKGEQYGITRCSMNDNDFDNFRGYIKLVNIQAKEALELTKSDGRGKRQDIVSHLLIMMVADIFELFLNKKATPSRDTIFYKVLEIVYEATDRPTKDIYHLTKKAVAAYNEAVENRKNLGSYSTTAPSLLDL